MAPTYSFENCNARCHQACNGLSIHQTRHAKSVGHSITWKCPQQGTGIAEIITPLPPVYEVPSRPFAVGKSCSVCKNPVRARYVDLAYHCTNPSCNNICHLAATCSGFVNPRGPARACALSTRVWYYHLHSSLSAGSHSATQPDTLPLRPTPPSLKSLLDQGLSLADAKTSKEKCAKCSAAWRSNTVPVRCSLCSKGFHQKCSTGPKASTLVIVIGNVKDATTFSRIMHLHLQIVSSLYLLTHLHNLCLLLCKISLKFTSGMLTVFVLNSWNSAIF